ncbi:Eco57I restriction-modification methylase domain-containing protein [Pseudomonas sp. B392_1p]|uniref:Eco57I restriction-modification methylase domain-containing protein n=1 Tax=Pseudomonas sp. B392_1p TaxID=3457507 RepID=UPI003FCFA5E3
MQKIRNKAHAALNLPSLRLEGTLFLPDQLEKAALGEAVRQTESDYLTPKGLRLKDDYSRAFQIACAQWRHFAPQTERSDLDPDSLTRTFVLELLRDAFGYHSIQVIAGFDANDRHYPVSLQAGLVPVVVAPHHLGLDTADERFAIAHASGGSRKKSAFQLAQEWLNASEDHLWALVTNGKQLRLLRDAETLTRPSYLEIDLQDLLGGQRFAEFAMAWRLLHASRAGQAGETPAQCIWEAWREAGKEEGTRVREGLRRGVEQALLTLGSGFIQHTANQELRQQLQSGALTKDAYFQQLLRLIYRLIFLFTVEERGLLHPADDSPGAQQARRAYAEGYAMARLRDRALKRRARNRFDDLWQAACIVFRGLQSGESRLALPALGGLFSQDQCPALDSASLSNADLLQVILHLRWDNASGSLAPVDYRNMGPEELGSVYESLLELVPEVDLPARQFGFAGLTSDGSSPSETAKGNARKTSGSYYTPDSLVQELIKSALEPVIAQRLADNPANPTAALLDIKVIDPACGSGHFLLAAARRLAEALAAQRSPEGAVKPQDYRHALREVISHCIFGVDRNPMALELCRTALWLEGFEEGRPLSFLDHHLQCGDALLGLTDLKVLETGIPAAAFKPLSGDAKDVCKELAKDNKAGLKQLERDLHSRQQQLRLDRASGLDQLQALEALPENTPEDIAARAAAYATFSAQADNSRIAQAADLLLGAFVLPKTEETANSIPTSQTLYLHLFTDQHNTQHQQQLEAARSACREARVFHWPLAFPQVFANGGFDCVIGNPPWEIVQARDVSADESLIARQKQWFSQGIYEVLNGRRDLYKLFIVLVKNVLSPSGIAGLILPIGFMFEEDSVVLRRQLFDKGTVISLLHLQNSKKHFFPDVHASYRFLAMTITPEILDEHRFSSVISSSSELDSAELITVNREQFDDVLGDARSAVLFNEFEQALLHRRVASNMFGMSQLRYRVVAEFHASSDKDVLTSRKDNDHCYGLLKNGSFHHFHPSFGPVEKWASRASVMEKLEKKGLDARGWIAMPKLVFRDIARNDDTRTLIPCLVPPGYVSTYDAPMIVPSQESQHKEHVLAFYAGYLTSFLADFLIRPFIDKHVKGYVLARVPIPNFDHANPLMKRASELSLNLAKESWSAAADLNEPNAANRQSQERVLIEAIFFRLAGLSRTDIVSIFDHFSSVRNEDLKKYGEYRTQQLVLDAWDQLGQQGNADTYDSCRLGAHQRSSIESALLADLSWQRLGADQRADTSVQLIALLKAANAPMGVRQVRLAAALAMEPRLMLPLLDEHQAKEWQRLIGDAARPLSSNVLAFASRSNNDWGAAVRHLRTNGYLIENQQDHTWAPDFRSSTFDTPAWADGRANWVLNVLRDMDIDALLTRLPEVAREWINDAA